MDHISSHFITLVVGAMCVYFQGLAHFLNVVLKDWSDMIYIISSKALLFMFFFLSFYKIWPIA